MGDRANIKVTEKYNGDVFLYSHWGGYKLPETAQKGMRTGKSQWDDAQYLTRVLFCEMVKWRPEGEITGLGISSLVGDGADRALIINCNDQTVEFPNKRTMTFQEFIDATNVGWEA